MSGLKEQLVQAAEQYGVIGLVVATFLDSFISPIPPEVVFIPLCLLNPPGALWLALITTFVSVAGALVGYLIGLVGGRPLLFRFFSQAKIKKAEELIEAHGVMAVLIASFTPVPFKLVTVTSGVLKMAPGKLLFWSTLGRGARFFLEAVLILLYGRASVEFLTGKWFSLLTLGLGVLGLLIYYLYRQRRGVKKNKKY